MKIKTLQLSLIVTLFVIQFNGIQCTGSVDTGSGSSGYTFPVLSHAPKGSGFKGRVLNPLPVKKGWLKMKGRATEDGETESEEPEPKSSNPDTKSEDPEIQTPKAKHLTSFTFTNDEDEGYDAVIERNKEEIMNQVEKENTEIDQDVEEFEAQNEGGGETQVRLRSGLTKLYEVHPSQVLPVDPVQYLKQLKRDYAKKNEEEMKRYQKRRKLMALMETEGLLKPQASTIHQ